MGEGRGGGWTWGQGIPVAAMTGRSLAESVLSKGPELWYKSGRAVLEPCTKFALGLTEI